MMNQDTKLGFRRPQRILSVNLISDSEDDNNVKKEEKNNDSLIQTQYSTPMAQLDAILMDINSTNITTNPAQLTLPSLSTQPFLLRSQQQQRQQTKTITTTATTAIAAAAVAVMRPESTNFETMFERMSPMPISPIGLCQPDYVPYTIKMDNQCRLSILPAYPIDNNINDDNNNIDDDDIDDDDNDHYQPVPPLLLANLPVNQLSQQESNRRQSGQYQCSFSIFDLNAHSTSFIVQLYQTYYTPLINRLHMDLALLDYNYVRVKNFIQLYHQAYLRTIPDAQQHQSFQQQQQQQQFHLNDNEYHQLLEFYLQIDVDLFYMKTCSFRNARPRNEREGIFCLTTPQCNYTIKPCGKCCLLCSHLFNNHNATTNYQEQQYPIQFNLFQKHRFVNGYESILNCPASCDTINIIYALTCLCGDYDYIGETSDHLLTRYLSHRTFTHRLIQEGLIGEKNYRQFYGDKSEQMKRKDRMRLYRHSIRCSHAIQSFLNQNPIYWIFVPMLNVQANQENLRYPITSTFRTAIANNNNNNEKFIQASINALPKPPTGYKFSNHQIEKQYDFFNKQLYREKMNDNFIVYKATIIAILPLNTSALFRQLIHSLFVTHAETKLNTLGHIFKSFMNAPINQGLWCENLCHPHPHHQQH